MAEDENPKKSSTDQIALYILQERLNELKETYQKKEDRDLQLFMQISGNQTTLSERLLVVETNNRHVSDAIIKLQKESSIQTKLLTGILLAAVGALVSIIVKAALGI